MQATGEAGHIPWKQEFYYYRCDAVHTILSLILSKARSYYFMCI